MRNELRVGIMLFTGLVLLVLLIATTTRWRQQRNAYTFTIRFTEASGIQTGAEVRVSGVKVGQVTTIYLEPGTNKALIVARVEKSVRLFSNYGYTIGIGGLVGERFVDIRPTSPPGEHVPPGGEVDGTTTADINDLFAQSSSLVLKLSKAVDNMNKIVGDTSTQRNIRLTVENLRRTSDSTAAFAKTLNAIALRNQGAIDLIVADLGSVARDVRRLSDQLTPQITSSNIFANLEQASKNAVSFTERLDKIATTAEVMFSDQSIPMDIKQAVLNLKQSSIDLEEIIDSVKTSIAPFPEVTENLKNATADLPKITEPFAKISPETASNILKVSQNLRNTSESIGGIVGDVSELGSALTALSSMSIEPEVRLSYLPNGPDNSRTDFNVDVRGKENLFRLGVTELGKSNDLNVQFGSKVGSDLWLRYGIMQSTFGAGVDYQPNANFLLTTELFNPVEPKANLLANYAIHSVAPGLWLTTGWYDVFEQGRFSFGLTYHPKSTPK